MILTKGEITLIRNTDQNPKAEEETVPIRKTY